MHIDQLPTNAARGVILALDDVASALKLKESDFVPVVWNAGLYNGKRYGIPLDIHPLGLYYNKSVMEKAGLDPDDPPQTKDDYMAALEQMKGKGIQGSWMSPFLFTGGLTFQALLYQFGGQLYNEDATKATFNSDAGVSALTWMVDVVKKGTAPRTWPRTPNSPPSRTAITPLCGTASGTSTRSTRSRTWTGAPPRCRR